jgi:hypothetical protein
MALLEKIKTLFSSYPEPKGLLGIFPKGPLKIEDDAMTRSFRFYDGDGNEFLSLSQSDVKELPESIKRYFTMNNSEREIAARKEMEKYVVVVQEPDDMVTTEIVESLREWASEN